MQTATGSMYLFTLKDFEQIVCSLVCYTAYEVLKLNMCQTSGLELWYSGELYMGDLHRDRYISACAAW